MIVYKNRVGFSSANNSQKQKISEPAALNEKTQTYQSGSEMHVLISISLNDDDVLLLIFDFNEKYCSGRNAPPQRFGCWRMVPNLFQSDWCFEPSPPSILFLLRNKPK